jgi:hypothetical protein
MINIDLLEGEVKNLAGIVNRNINAMTIAAMIAKNFNNVAGCDKRNSNASITFSDPVASNWVIKTSGDKYVDLLIDACAKLDDGNPDQGIDPYPENERAIIIRPALKAEVLKSMVGLYGGVGVYDVLKNGGLDRNTKPAVATTGYVGEINNTPVYCASAVVWSLAERYLGLTAGTLDNLVALVVSGTGTGRALAFNSKIKTVDAQEGQGLKLQPKYRFGAECWDALSVVPVFSATFDNPVTVTGTGDNKTANALYMRGTGSR